MGRPTNFSRQTFEAYWTDRIFSAVHKQQSKTTSYSAPGHRTVHYYVAHGS